MERLTIEIEGHDVDAIFLKEVLLQIKMWGHSSVGWVVANRMERRCEQALLKSEIIVSPTANLYLLNDLEKCQSLFKYVIQFLEGESKMDNGLRYWKSHPNAKIIAPDVGNAGYDICSVEDVIISAAHNSVAPYSDEAQQIHSALFGYDVPGRVLIHTGIHLEIPEGWVGIIKDRSSLSAGNKRKNILGGLITIAGVIDSSYRGEVIVAMINLTHNSQELNLGDKIAQIVIVPHLDYYLHEVLDLEALSETKRGSDGFGSTGR